MAVCSLMVLGRRIEASHMTVSCLGELDLNEMKSKRSNMISLWNTHGYRTYLFGIEPAELQAVRVATQGLCWRSASSGLWPQVAPSGLNKPQLCLRSSNSEHSLVMVGVTVYLRDSHRPRRCGVSVGRVYLQNIGITTYNVLITIRARRRPEDGEMRRRKVIYHCS